MHGDVAGHQTARHTVSVGHRHMRVGRRCRQAHAAHQLHVDEVVRGAAVEEGREAVAVDVDRYHHRVLRADAGDAVQGNHRGGLLGWLGVGVSGRRAVLAVGRVVAHLQEEEALALVSADVGLVAVVAEALAAAFHHLSRRQAAKHPGWRRRYGRRWGGQGQQRRDWRGRERHFRRRWQRETLGRAP